MYVSNFPLLRVFSKFICELYDLGYYPSHGLMEITTFQKQTKIFIGLKIELLLEMLYVDFYFYFENSCKLVGVARRNKYLVNTSIRLEMIPTMGLHSSNFLACKFTLYGQISGAFFPNFTQAKLPPFRPSQSFLWQILCFMHTNIAAFDGFLQFTCRL